MNSQDIPLRFPDRFEEARARAAEFRALSSDARIREIAALYEVGMLLVSISPHRKAIEERWLAQEEEWRRIQQQLFAEYARRCASDAAEPSPT